MTIEIDRDQVEAYRRDGCVHVPGVFDIAEIDALRRLVFRLYRKFQPGDDSLDGESEPWNSPAFDRQMIALRARDPQVFGALYDCAQSALNVARLVSDPRLVALAAACLDDAPENLAYSGIMFRMDPPKDKRNAIDWHQDRAYYPQNVDGNQGLVVTVALQDITAETGALVVCPGSQRHGFVAPVTTEKSDYETTEQRAIPTELVDQFDHRFAEMKKGDVALMNMNLFHRSGTNDGEHIRYTALCRFHRIMAEDYVPFGLLYQFNDFLADRIWNARKQS